MKHHIYFNYKSVASVWRNGWGRLGKDEPTTTCCCPRKYGRLNIIRTHQNDAETSPQGLTLAKPANLSKNMTILSHETGDHESMLTQSMLTQVDEK